nr:hypothetical protein DA06_09295 [Georgenia sp. SUBG003]
MVPLVHACLSGRRGPKDEPGRSAFATATEEFVLRAVGAPLTGPVTVAPEATQDAAQDGAPAAAQVA